MPCVELIEHSKNEDAYKLYRSYTKMLQKQYVADLL